MKLKNTFALFKKPMLLCPFLGLIFILFFFSQCLDSGGGSSSSTPALAPDDDSVQSLTATAGDGQVELFWTNPDSSFDHVAIFHKQGSAVSGTDDVEATEYNAGTAESYLFTNLTNDKIYHFSVYTYKQKSGYSSAQTTSATPMAVAPDPIQSLTATARNKRVELSWTNPDSSFDHVAIFHKQGSAVNGTDDADATEDNVGTAESYLFTNLTNGEIYHFSVFTFKNNSGYSKMEATSATPGKIPDTGQTKSYTDTFGEDSDYNDLSRARSYTDNGDKTVTDNVTGLMWEQLPDYKDHIQKTWKEVQTECENRTTGEHTDWRLPNLQELRSLVSYDRYDPAINTDYFPRTAKEIKRVSYWSSTATYYEGDSFSPGETERAWLVLFLNGDIDSVETKEDNYVASFYVRCVRGG